MCCEALIPLFFLKKTHTFKNYIYFKVYKSTKQTAKAVYKVTTNSQDEVRILEISLFSHLNTSFRSCYKPNKYECLVYFCVTLTVH